MKMKRKLSMLGAAVVMVFAIAACGSKNDNPGPVLPQSKCLSDKMQLKLTKVNNLTSSHTVLLSFDVKNTSNETFDVQKGYKFIMAEIKVTTTDNMVYTNNVPFTSEKIEPGQTITEEVGGEYGANKTYKSYTIRLYCE